MLSKNKLFVTVLIILSITLSVATTNAAGTTKTAIASGSNTYPYLAKPVSNNVNIRSGGGTAYYACGKLSLNEAVTVVAEEFGWAKIVPPKGSFSWIAEKYIRIDKSNPKVGIVTGNNVRVWVGSPEYDALTSSTTQTKLSSSKFDIVELLGTEENDYLKIAPPAGAYLYVFASNLKYVGPVGAIGTPARKAPIVKPKKTYNTVKTPVKATENKVPEKKVETSTTKPEPKVTSTPETQKLISTCREIADKAEAETEKPYSEQDYTKLKEAVNAIVNDPKAAQAKVYAQYLMQLIDRYELVSIIDKELKSHTETLITGKEKIEGRRDSRIDSVVDTGKYVVTGVIKPSNIFTGAQKRYVIRDDNGRITCYAIPGSYLSDAILQKFYNKRVALEGTIETKSYGTVSLIKFSSIVEADSIK